MPTLRIIITAMNTVIMGIITNTMFIIITIMIMNTEEDPIGALQVQE